MIGEWNLDIQRAISNSRTFDTGHVGNHGVNQSGYVDLNQPTPGTETGEQQRRPYYSQFPYLSTIFGKSAGTPDVVNSAPVFGTGGPRKIQLGAKFIF